VECYRRKPTKLFATEEKQRQILEILEHSLDVKYIFPDKHE
jgi:hypothetical protein